MSDNFACFAFSFKPLWHCCAPGTISDSVIEAVNRFTMHSFDAQFILNIAFQRAVLACGKNGNTVIERLLKVI